MDLPLRSVLPVKSIGIDTWQSSNGEYFQELDPSYEFRSEDQKLLEIVKLHNNFWVGLDEYKCERFFELVHVQGKPFFSAAREKTYGASNYPSEHTGGSYTYNNKWSNTELCNETAVSVRTPPQPKPRLSLNQHATKARKKPGYTDDAVTLRHTELQLPIQRSKDAAEVENSQIDQNGAKNVPLSSSLCAKDGRPQAKQGIRTRTRSINHSYDTSEFKSGLLRQFQQFMHSGDAQHMLTFSLTSGTIRLQNGEDKDNTDIQPIQPSDAGNANHKTRTSHVADQKHPQIAGCCDEDEEGVGEATQCHLSKETSTEASKIPKENLLEEEAHSIHEILSDSLDKESVEDINRDYTSVTTHDHDSPEHKTPELNLTLTPSDTGSSDIPPCSQECEVASFSEIDGEAEEQQHRMDEYTAQTKEPLKVDIPEQNNSDGSVLISETASQDVVCTEKGFNNDSTASGSGASKSQIAQLPPTAAEVFPNLTSRQENEESEDGIPPSTYLPSCPASSGIGDDEASLVSQAVDGAHRGSFVDSHSELNLSDMETAEESAEYISDDGKFDKLISDVDSIFNEAGILEWQAMQDPGDLKKIFLFSKEVLRVKEELANAANEYEGYRLVLRQQNEIFTPLTGFKESARMPFTFKTWKTDEQGRRSVITQSTCEMIVRAEARCRNGKPVECDFFAVVSAHHILTPQQRFDMRCVDHQPTFNEIWDKICSPSQNLSFGLVANDTGKEVIDTVGTPLYRQWHFMPTTGYGVHEFDSFANDILLFRLDYSQLKAQGWLEKDPNTQLSRLEVYSGPFSLGHDNYKYVHAKIKGIVPLRNKKGYRKLISKRGIKVIVNKKLGKLEVTRFITKTKTNHFPGYHLALSLDSGLRLEKGDSGSVVYTISKADKKQVYALGMLVGSFKDSEMSCEGLYQAIALWPALRQIEYHHSERIGDIRLIGCDEVKDKESDKLLPDFADSGMFET